MKLSQRIKRQRETTEEARQYYVILLRVGDQGNGKVLTAEALRELGVCERGIKFDEELQALVYTGETDFDEVSAEDRYALSGVYEKAGTFKLEPGFDAAGNIHEVSICPVVRVNEKK